MNLFDNQSGFVSSASRSKFANIVFSGIMIVLIISGDKRQERAEKLKSGRSGSKKREDENNE